MPSARAAPAPTVVTLTFDDGDANQFAAARSMAAHGLFGTFYITTSWVGDDGYLTREEVDDLAAAGHEIGGHTVTHADLTAVPPAEMEAEICNGRAVLESWGHRPTNFSYPYSTTSPEVRGLAAGCGYTTARELGDVASPFGCLGCPVAETMPPLDPHHLRAPAQVDARWTLDQLKRAVTEAVHGGGGWVVLTFHRVCAPIGTAACPVDLSTSPALFNAFAAWLDAFRDDPANNTTVRTVADTVQQYRGPDQPDYQPARTALPRPPEPEGANALSNPSLEVVDPATGFPSCWLPAGWGDRRTRWETVSPGRSGAVAQQLRISQHEDGDAKLVPTMDLHTCAPTVRPGAHYEVSGWYRSTGRTQIAVYYRDASWNWITWESSSWFETSPDAWAQARFITPPVPDHATALAFGLVLAGEGTLTTDDYVMAETDARPSAVPSSDVEDTMSLADSPYVWSFLGALVLQAVLFAGRPSRHRRRTAS